MQHRYFGVLAPNSPWRELVATSAGRKLGAGSKAPQPKTVRADFGASRAGHPARYLWLQLLSRIYWVFALKWSGCVGRCAWLGSSQSQRPCGRYLNMLVSQPVPRQSPRFFSPFGKFRQRGCFTPHSPELITEPATVRQMLEHEGEPTSAPAIFAACSPPLEMKIGQELAAPEAGFEAVPELEFDQMANLRAEAGNDRLLHIAGIDAEPIPELEYDQTLRW